MDNQTQAAAAAQLIETWTEPSWKLIIIKAWKKAS